MPEATEISDLTSFEPKEAKEGDAHRLPIKRADDYFFARVDQVTVMQPSPGEVDLVCTGNRPRALYQALTVQEANETGVTLIPTGVQVAPEILELGALRLDNDNALEIALIILRVLARESPDKIKERLALEGFA